jgi:hypothetical protein
VSAWTDRPDSTTLDDVVLPAPDVLATEVPLASLTGTAKGLVLAAERAGYTVRAKRALGPRIPKRVNDPVVRQSSLAVLGVMGAWSFLAVHGDVDGWDVTLHRPGWPPEPANVTRLRTLFAAQAPAVIRG